MHLLASGGLTMAHVCRFRLQKDTSLWVIHPQCTLLPSQHWDELHSRHLPGSYSNITPRKCGLGRRTQGLRVTFGTGPQECEFTRLMKLLLVLMQQLVGSFKIQVWLCVIYVVNLRKTIFYTIIDNCYSKNPSEIPKEPMANKPPTDSTVYFALAVCVV